VAHPTTLATVAARKEAQVTKPLTPEWYAQVDETVVDPDQRINDPHHHLWPPGGVLPYGLDELSADVRSGHLVERTVFVECGAAYATDGPLWLRPVGETAFVAAVSARDPGHLISGIVAHVDLADLEHIDEALDAHETEGAGLLRGVRDVGASAEHPEALMIPGRAAPERYGDPRFRAGIARLGQRSLTYDAWHYHYQNLEFAALARAVPDTMMVLDHFGTPLGVGPYADRREEIFEQWKLDLAEIARCDNVVAKIGGLAMPDNGFGWHTAERPPTSDEFVAQQRRYYDHAIECFGPERCMFESNFPVDRFSLSYRVLWNGLKKIAAPFSPSERDAMMFANAARVYRLEQ
jgi:predicted TIM-barrel fold metal-dependent hydrolase